MATLERNDKTRISGPMLIVLQLVPGLLFGGVFYVLSRMFIRWGLTGYLALLVTIPLCLAPIQLGVMLLWSKRATGRYSLSEAIGFRRRGTAFDYLLLPVLLFLAWAVISVAILPISEYLETHVSIWLPSWATQRALIEGLGSVSSLQRSITLGLAVVLSGFVAPVVEEMYFRGFLLPRMKHWGWAAPVINSFLFAVYHFYFPENVPGIFLAFLLLSPVVMVKRNWRIGLVVHSMSNLWGVVSVAMQIM